MPGFTQIEKKKAILVIKTNYYRLCIANRKQELTKTDLRNYLIKQVEECSNKPNSHICEEDFKSLKIFYNGKKPKGLDRLLYLLKKDGSMGDDTKEIFDAFENFPLTSVQNVSKSHINSEKEIKTTNEVLNFSLFFFGIPPHELLERDLNSIDTDFRDALDEYNLNFAPKEAIKLVQTQTSLELKRITKQIRSSAKRRMYFLGIGLLVIAIIIILWIVSIFDRPTYSQENQAIVFEEAIENLIQPQKSGINLIHITTTENEGGVMNVFLRIDNYGSDSSLIIDEIFIKIITKETSQNTFKRISSKYDNISHFILNTEQKTYTLPIFNTDDNNIIPQNSSVPFTFRVKKEEESPSIIYQFETGLIGHLNDGKKVTVTCKEVFKAR